MRFKKLPQLYSFGLAAITGLFVVAMAPRGLAGAGSICERYYIEDSDFNEGTFDGVVTNIGQIELGAGETSGSWTVVHDSIAPGVEWAWLDWESDVPAGASLTVEVRAADSVAGLSALPYVTVDDEVNFAGSGVVGQFVQVLVTMERIASGESPVLYELGVVCSDLAPQQCALEIEAFCAIPKSPVGADGDDCDGAKVEALTIAYTADDCTVMAHTQDAGKVSCEGVAGPLPDHAYVVVSDESEASDALAGNGKIYFSGAVSTAVPFTATAANAGEDRFGSGTFVHIFASASGPLLQAVEFHTSCSQPLAVGNQFGATLIMGLAFDDNRVVTLPTPDPSVKECEIPLPGGAICPDGDDIYSLDFLYTGEDCLATSHRQDPGKVTCEDFGTGSLPDPAWVVVTDNEKLHEVLEGKGKIFFEGSAGLNTIVNSTAANAGEDKFKGKTFLYVFDGEDGELRQRSEFHTSCSQPLYTGDQFGAFVVTASDTKDAGRVSLVGPAECVKYCEAQLTPGEICPDGDDVSSIDLIYTAEDCSFTSHGQDSGKVECVDHATLTNTVYVVVSDRDKPDEALAGEGNRYFAGTVSENELFTASAANAGTDKFKSGTFIYAFTDANGGLLQSVEFHTSCSQPLTTSDQFGAFAVFGAETKDAGTVSEGVQATFVYEVTNTGSDDLTNVVVTDNFGEVEGSPIATLASGETVTLYRAVQTTEDIDNTAVASTLDGSGDPCESASSATVAVIPPPPFPVECDSRVEAMLLSYIGPDVPGNVTVVISPDKGTPVSYTFPSPAGLTTGTILSSSAQNEFTIDASVSGENELGSKVFISINGVEPDSGIHTSCSAPFVAGQPAPLNDPKGDPSPNWFVELFRQQN